MAQQRLGRRSRIKLGSFALNFVAHKPLKARSEFIRLPIPDISEIRKPPFLTEGIPVEGMPQDMQTFPRRAS